MLLLIRSAQERVACFLLEMAERMAESDVINLPMSRQDIADYLGLTIETISRTLRQLETAAAMVPRSPAPHFSPPRNERLSARRHSRIDENS